MRHVEKVRLNYEEVQLPASDGHVALFACQHNLGRDRAFEKEVYVSDFSSAFCEQCVQDGLNTLADYVYQPAEVSLAGPLMGDPDYWPPDISGRQFLCQEHYARLPADSRMEYVPAQNHPEPYEEM